MYRFKQQSAECTSQILATASPTPWRASLLVAAALVIGAACSKRSPIEIPGSTHAPIRDISIVAADGGALAVNYKPLFDTLGLRKGSVLRPERSFNPFRLAEDRRRVATHMHLQGFFDGIVQKPVVKRDQSGVSVIWKVSEGKRYHIRNVQLISAPSKHREALRAMIPFDPGDPIDVRRYRPLRRILAEYLQAKGFGHARVFSRAYIDRQSKAVDWYYFVDAGPPTIVGSLTIEGNVNVPESMIRERIELAVGHPYSTHTARRAETALLDSGAFRSVVVLTNADILKGPPQWPDTGGRLDSSQISDEGDLVPRDLNPALEVRVIVVEAPSRQLRAEVGAELDPFRADVFTGAQTIFRNLGGAQNHFLARGDLGYGWRFNELSDPTGFYGQLLGRFTRAGWLGPRLDGRLTARLSEQLFPSASVREFSVGPGLRTVVADRLFFDIDVVYAHSKELGLDGVGEPTRMELSLATDPISSGVRANTSIVLDLRNDRVEASAGNFLSGEVEVSPGGALSSHRYARFTLDARHFIRISDSMSVGVRSRGSLLGLVSSNGAPLGARLFGGGAYGFRGVGRQQLASFVCAEPVVGCDHIVVGGLSLVEATVEARFLPFRALYGAVAFVDVGAVSTSQNPFNDGAYGAFGLGLRARTFWIPISIDVAYRALEQNHWLGPGALDRWTLLFRIGEAF